MTSWSFTIGPAMLPQSIAVCRFAWLSCTSIACGVLSRSSSLTLTLALVVSIAAVTGAAVAVAAGATTVALPLLETGKTFGNGYCGVGFRLAQVPWWMCAG